MAPFSSLRSYKEPNYSSLGPGVQVLVEGEGGVWGRGEVLEELMGEFMVQTSQVGVVLLSCHSTCYLLSALYSLLFPLYLLHTPVWPHIEIRPFKSYLVTNMCRACPCPKGFW